LSTSYLGLPEVRPGYQDPADVDIHTWVENAVASAPNKAHLQQRLASIESDETLLCFLHRFVLFNDALAARVPYLAGLIHLTPNLFVAADVDEEFCRQYNGRIAAFVAEAASDEYQMTEEQSLVHQYLSQLFFLGALEQFGLDGKSFNRRFPVPDLLKVLLGEARERHFLTREPEQLFAALGFHVGLEVFAHQEFNLVDAWLREQRPALVAYLKRGGQTGSAYRWLAIHTVVEIRHYRAGLEALKLALETYHKPDDRPRMASRIREGLASFIDLQGRFYEAILCDMA
jgi:hypothetical protein